MKKNLLLLFALLAIFNQKAKADEGMWLPLFVSQNVAEMEALGLKLSAEDLYSVNKSSLKDAVVRLGSGFCTGEMISSEGLLLTNHHCGYSAIQGLSSVDADYLKDGYWAYEANQELPVSFSVSYLQEVIDITEIALEGTEINQNEDERSKIISQNLIDYENSLELGQFEEVNIKSMYSGNQYLAFFYENFKDVRFVGAPPTSIGKFGGETDNWMWPRHTGDFSLFRVYSNRDNKAAEYSEDNVPYKPKKHFKLNIGEKSEKDYAMIFGYPGSTDRYLSSYGVKLATEKDQPTRVKLRRTKLDVYEKYMDKDPKVKIQYAAKYAQVSNYWKYFIGQTKGLKALKVYEKKKMKEAEFMKWANGNNESKNLYGEVDELYKKAYQLYDDKNIELAQTYFFEAIYGIELIQAGFNLSRFEGALAQLATAEKDDGKDSESYKKAVEALEAAKKNLENWSKGFFKDFHKPVDEEVFMKMVMLYDQGLTDELKPQEFTKMMSKYGRIDKLNKFKNKIYGKSILVNQDKLNEFIQDPSLKKLNKDKGYVFAKYFINFYYENLRSMSQEADQLRERADRLYKAGLLEINSYKSMYPNANSTMRITYGTIGSYYPKDATFYEYYTTIEGIAQKEDPKNKEFVVPAKLMELYKNKDYGQYANSKGELVVCFISNNDITGGNSGSPVIDGNGHLIGTAFDGNWEAMSGDIAFEPELQRTISVDIRYTLFIIDKFANCQRLIKEVDIVK